MKTLQEALTLVPTHLPLVPGVDKWKKGDEWLKFHTRGYSYPFQWHEMKSEKDYDGHITCEARRPVPQSVREAEAYRYLMDGDLHPKHSTPIINAISNEGLKLARKHKHPLLSWVEENRK